MNPVCLWGVFAVFLQWTVSGQQLVSQGKPITSSSTFGTWSPDRAVDGIRSLEPKCDCCAATDDDSEPWYKLDLEQTYMVQKIIVRGALGFSLHEIELKLGTSSEDETVLTNNTFRAFAFYYYTLPSPQLGRYVTLTKRGIPEMFVICELEVYADCSGNTYGNPCVLFGNCLNDDPCDKNDACEDGKYGPNCVSNCEKCLNNATCDEQDGRCDSCAAGYKGDKCFDVCDLSTYGEDCKELCGNCSNNAPCNRVDGSCPRGCRPGFKGELCKEACEDGKYGPNCVSNCGNCLNNATCDEQDGRCVSCAAGYKGDKCLDICDLFTYGEDCKEICGSCSNNASCNHVDGSCPRGCRPGFKRELCKEECGVYTYGNSCIPCGHCLNDTPCDKQDGTCSSCTAGYFGDKCEKVCSDGSFGIDCQSMCGKCHRQSVCLKDTGNCPQGCEPGFLGPLCHKECEDGTYGEGCTSICGNCHGDEICNKQNGTCQACECGYTGHDCKGTLGDITAAASRCDWPNVAMIVGGTVVSILAIEGVAAAICFFIRKRRHSLQDTINLTNLYELRNRGINEGEHNYESAMELDVNTNAYENTGPQAP